MDETHTGPNALLVGDFHSAKLKIDQYYVDWLLQEGEEIIDALVNHVNIQDLNSSFPPVAKPVFSSDQFIASAEPPRSPNKKSPKKRSQSEMLNKIHVSEFVEQLGASMSSKSVASDDGDTVTEFTTSRRRNNFDSIPRFYVPGSRTHSYAHPIDEDQLVKRLPEIEAFFKPFPNGVPVEKFVHVTKKLCGIPSFFNLPLCLRINELYGEEAPRPVNKMGKRQTAGINVKLKSFLQYWQAEIEPYSRVERFFRSIKQTKANWIFKDDFAPFIQELLHFHPGLDFLEAHEEFQRKYALTVVTRIFYRVNTSRSGKISLREVRNSNLFQEFMHVDEETDINRITEYFSYEHFYVLYCRFFELDTDKDSKLSREDLLKYNEHSLSEAIVDRIMQVGSRVFTDGHEGGFLTSGMTYPDFVYFMLAEEDRSSTTALRYWFTCCDLDGDGKLTPDKMWHFYRVQLHRVTSLGQESILFQDVLCQMIDYICPVNPLAITIEDLIKPDKRRISGVLFDVLFNLHKFIRFETRDPFQEKQKREDGFNCDWDRFAHSEYHRLASEEESYDNSNNNNYSYSMNDMGSMEVDMGNGNSPLSSKYGNEDSDSDSSDDDVVQPRGGGGGNRGTGNSFGSNNKSNSFSNKKGSGSTKSSSSKSANKRK